ncbi:hypothetical protein RHSIM_Rhsim02G0103500 [Rhododendron simsii]|uniref:Reverse transcriptase n=1 Tax=Rhododendron simsii TaxID=118357 RepID=A0A834H9G0_RHOSS|nr:hypothetical protein RHSIM_Rhsim02G0103500 [Rhododendron simsii]
MPCAPFRFNARWVEDDEVRDVIRQAWANPVPGSRSFMVVKKVQACRSSLSNWKRRKWLNSRREIEELKAKNFVPSNSRAGPPPGVVQNLKRRLKEEWDKEELFWKQKSIVVWLQHGDKNTQFFHASVMQWRSFNRISGIENSNGMWTEDSHEVQAVFQHFFFGIFTAGSNLNMQDTVNGIPHKITNAMNQSLTRSITNLEVKSALDDMGSTKAPGVDGITPLFFQSYWPTVGEDVTVAVKSFFHTSHLLHSLNQTLITFIPKVNCPTKPEGFHYLIQEAIRDRNLFGIKKYEEASGQIVDREKSSLFFSPNTPNEVENIWGCRLSLGNLNLRSVFAKIFFVLSVNSGGVSRMGRIKLVGASLKASIFIIHPFGTLVALVQHLGLGGALLQAEMSLERGGAGFQMGANLCCINGPSRSRNKRPKPKIITSSVQQHHVSTPEKTTPTAEHLTLGACLLEEDINDGTFIVEADFFTPRTSFFSPRTSFYSPTNSLSFQEIVEDEGGEEEEIIFGKNLYWWRG